MSAQSHAERRQFPRSMCIRDCKLRGPWSASFAPAQTSNLSPTGALLRVASERAFGVNDELELALPGVGEAVVATERLMRATVRRVIPIDHHHQAIGVEFRSAIDLAPIAQAA